MRSTSISSHHHRQQQQQARHRQSTRPPSHLLLLALAALALAARPARAGPSSFLRKGTEIACTKGLPVDLSAHIGQATGGDKMRVSNCIQDGQGGWISCDCPDGYIRCDFSPDCGRATSGPASALREGALKLASSQQGARQSSRAHPGPSKPKPGGKPVHRLPQGATIRKGSTFYQMAAGGESRSQVQHSDLVATAEALGLTLDQLIAKRERNFQRISDRTSLGPATTTTTSTTTTTTTTLPPSTTTEFVTLGSEQYLDEDTTDPELLAELEGPLSTTPPTTTTTSTTPVAPTTIFATTGTPISPINNNHLFTGRVIHEQAEQAEQISNDAIFYLAIGAELFVIVLIFSLAAFFRYRDLVASSQLPMYLDK